MDVDTRRAATGVSFGGRFSVRILELKYPKDSFIGTVSPDGHPEDFHLPIGDAGLVDIWKDVVRIETLLHSDTFAAGAVVVLTNFKLWQANARPNQLSQFVLFQDRLVPVGSTLELAVGTTWARDGIRFKLESSYRCHWQDYSSLDRTEFKYLILEPARTH